MKQSELLDLAKSTIEEVKEVVDRIRKSNKSFFRRPARYEIDYLCTSVDNLGDTVLNLTENCVRFEALVALKDEEIAELRQNLQNT